MQQTRAPDVTDLRHELAQALDSVFSGSLRLETPGTASLDLGERNMGVIIGSDTVGYVFRTDCAAHDWSYIGQSSRLASEHVRGYFGSGHNIQLAIEEHGTASLKKTVLATASNELELHYQEMLFIAEARAEGVRLLNGDFGGPRPFPTMQAHLLNEVPEMIYASMERDWKKFHRLLVKKRPLVEAAIQSTAGTSTDDFYAGLERDLIAVSDVSRPCPSCGSPAGAVCRTNSKSLTKPRNPCVNHRARPRSA